MGPGQSKGQGAGKTPKPGPLRAGAGLSLPSGRLHLCSDGLGPDTLILRKQTKPRSRGPRVHRVSALCTQSFTLAAPAGFPPPPAAPPFYEWGSRGPGT